jgi:hypothetical protein
LLQDGCSIRPDFILFLTDINYFSRRKKMLIKDYYGAGECPECHCDIPDTAKAGDVCSCGNHTFVKTFNKVTIGFVIQNYKTLPNGTHVCIGQEFVAGEESYESTEYGDKLDDVDTSKEVDCSFNMVQPMHMPFPDK